MQSKRSAEFEERFLCFGVDVIKLVIKHSEIPRSVASQVIRSSAGVGANYAEAQNAISRADFKNKIFISKKEAAETRYWLRLIEKLTSSDLLAGYLKESQEILLILQKIVNTLSKPAT